MIKMSHLATALLLASISVAHAETTNQPVAQGEASVDKNLSKDKDNKGLQTADKRLEANEAKIAEKRAEADKREDAKNKNKKEEKHEHMEKHDHDKMERVAKIDKIDRPARIERPGK